MTPAKNFAHEQTILLAQMGSRSVGTETPESDFDYMSVVLGSTDVYLGLDNWGQQGTKEMTDADSGVLQESTAIEFRKFLKLCESFNPNVIPLLWLDKSSYTVVSPIGQALLDSRGMFNSKVAIHSFAGYAHNQLKKMGEDDASTGRMGAKRKALRDKYGYDTKYAYHTVRLARMIVEFLETDGRELNVYRKNIDADYLVGIRNGSKTHAEVVAEVGALLDKARGLADKSNLPEKPNHEMINDFCKNALALHLDGRGSDQYIHKYV